MKHCIALRVRDSVSPDDSVAKDILFFYANIKQGHMKPHHTFIVATTVFLAVLVFCMVAHKQPCTLSKEGFQNQSIEKRYAALRQLIKERIQPFCDLSSKIRTKLRDTLMKVQQMTSQPSSIVKPPVPQGLPFTGKPVQTAPTVPDIAPEPLPPGDINKQIDTVYLEGLKRPPINCTMFTLPDWSESRKDEIATTLVTIPDTLPILMAQEITFYSNAINQLLQSISTMKNPPPDIGKNESAKKEGFAGAVCSPAAAQARLLAARRAQEDAEARKKSEEEARRQAALQREAATCIIPDASSQINRVTALISKPEFAEMAKVCLKLSKDIDYINEVEKKAQIQGLFNDSGSNKSYKSFGGGDRLQALIHTLQSVQP